MIAHIVHFIGRLIRPKKASAELEEGYRQMAEDEANEREALEWAEATVGDVADESQETLAR